MIERIKSRVRSFVANALQTYDQRATYKLRRETERNAMLLGQIRNAQLAAIGPLKRLRAAEFRVFSQFGEDGIIQYLLRHVPIENKTFIEFGVETYEEANTRYLLVNDNWRGLVIDGDPNLVPRLRQSPLSWQNELIGVSAFIDADNVNGLFEQHGFRGDIGLLSIDVDGNDYWLWKAITVVSPRIVICEYNSVFGDLYPVTVPYRPDFQKRRAHYSDLYFGASLPALCDLAQTKGYTFVGATTEGLNAFFVRNDVVGDLPRPGVREEYAISRFRSSVDASGALTFLTGEERLAAMADKHVDDTRTGRSRRVGDLLRPEEG